MKIVKFLEGIGIGVIVFAVLALMSFLLAWPFMWSWNKGMVPAVTFANPIGYWQSYSLCLLVWFFVKPTHTPNRD